MRNQDKIRHYKISDKEYPKRLLEINNPPDILYVKGRLPDPSHPSIAIVGARNASPYGKKIAFEFARELSLNGVQVISGFARGIDRAGHEGAMAGGTGTFAVMGNGLDICYPRENVDLYEHILQSGGFLSEFPMQTPPKTWNFPLRNRIISALSDKILVVEAKQKSGSLITADYGLDQGKDVYAVPGRIMDELSRGCNWLISQGAEVAVSPEEILKDFGIENKNIKKFQEKHQLALAQDEKTVYSCIGLEPKHVEEIMTECQMKLPVLIPVLLQLELKNLIQEISKNSYIRVCR